MGRFTVVLPEHEEKGRLGNGNQTNIRKKILVRHTYTITTKSVQYLT